MSIVVKHGLPCYCDMLVLLNDYDDDDDDVAVSQVYCINFVIHRLWLWLLEPVQPTT